MLVGGDLSLLVGTFEAVERIATRSRWRHLQGAVLVPPMGVRPAAGWFDMPDGTLVVFH